MVQIPIASTSPNKQRSILPSKLLSDRKIRNAESTSVVLNAYELDTTFIDKVYKYELKFLGFYSSEKVKDLSIGPKNDVAKQTRPAMLYAMFEQMIRANPDTFGPREHVKQYVYDRGINMYSAKKLCNQGDKIEFTINMDELPERSRTYLGTRITSIKANILACETIDLRSLNAVEESGGDHSVLQFLEILSSQEVFRRESHCVFGNKMFDKGSEIRLPADPRVLKEGMQKNIRFVGDSLDSAVPILQIDPKKSPFFPNTTLDVFLTKFLPGHSSARLDEKLTKNTMRMALGQIKGLAVSTTHMAHGKNRSFTISGLTDKGASEITFEYHGTIISAEKYYERTYELRLRYPHLPCIVEKRQSNSGYGQLSENYYPMELCVIVAGQRVSINQQTPHLTEQMIRNCQSLPRDFVNNNRKQQERARLTSDNSYFRSHNIRVNNELQCADAEVLFPPSIVYGRNQREECDQKGFMKWGSVGNKHFVVVAKTPQVWAAALFQRGVESNSCNQFIDNFVSAAKAKGMQVERPNFFVSFDQTDTDYIREKLKGCKARKVNFIIFFTKDNRDEAHQRMKLMEVEFGIATQHICNQTVQKALGNKGAYMVIDNLLLKFNLKLGGINHGLSTGRALVDANHIGHDVVANEWLRETRMFIGLDMSHAAPQILYERQSKIACGEPTVVGMSYTIGHPLKMRGTYWCQQSRVTHIKQLTDNVKGP